MKRKHIHTRTISRLPPEAFIEEYINDTKAEDDIQTKPKHLNIKFNKSKRKKTETARVILLGTENTGKTSIFNQLRFLCGSHGISSIELIQCKILCIRHLVKCASLLCSKCIENHNLFPNVSEKNRKIVIKYASYTEFYIGSMSIDFEDGLQNILDLKKDLKHIFQDKGVIATFTYYHFKLILNSEYFLSKLYKYFDPKYECIFEDYLMLYHQTDVPTDELIEDERWSITVTDVCGNRRLRTSWSSVLNIRYTAALFVISLSDYNQFHRNTNNNMCYNKLIEQFELFSNITKVEQFMDNISNLIIILNKKDLFEKQLMKYKISFYEYFPLFLCDRFHYENKDKTYTDSIYDKENNDLQAIAKKNRLQFVFDKSKEFESQYIIEYIKKELVQMLPVEIHKNLRIYITCVIHNTFQYVAQTLTQEIVHMEQMYKSLESMK